MKRNELDAIFTAKVNEYLANGYMINTNTMGGNQGEIAHVDFRKDDEVARLLMETECDQLDRNVVRITIGRSANQINPLQESATIWNGNLEIIEEFVFLKESKDRFTPIEK